MTLKAIHEGWMGAVGEFGSLGLGLRILAGVILYYLVGLLHVVALARTGWTFRVEGHHTGDGVWHPRKEGDCSSVDTVMRVWWLEDGWLLFVVLPRWVARQVKAVDPLPEKDELLDSPVAGDRRPPRKP